MHHVFPYFCRWFRRGLVYLLTVGSLAAQMVSGTQSNFYGTSAGRASIGGIVPVGEPGANTFNVTISYSVQIKASQPAYENPGYPKPSPGFKVASASGPSFGAVGGFGGSYTFTNVIFYPDENGKLRTGLVMHFNDINYSSAYVYAQAMSKFTLRFKNDNPFKEEYVIKQGDQELGRMVLGPGEEKIATFKSTNSDPAQISRQSYGGYTDTEGFWKATPMGTLTPVGGPINGTPITDPNNPIDVPQAPPVDPGPAGGTGGDTPGTSPVWGPPSAEGLDAATYKQGVEEIKKAIEDNAGGGGETEPLDLTPITSRQDTQTAHLDEIEKNTKKQKEHIEALDTLKTARPTLSAMQTQGDASAGLLESAIGTVAVASSSVTTSQPSVFAITDPFTGRTFDMNPFRSDRFGPVANWLKALMAWLLVLAFARWSIKESFVSVDVVFKAQQATGNPVVAGTGAQATALIAAAAIAAIIISTGTVIFAAWRDTEIGGMSILSALSTNYLTGVSGIVAGSIWMLDQILPLGTICAYLFSRVTFPLITNTTAYAAAMVIRFIVP